MGTVPKEVPMPMVTARPTMSMKKAAMSLFPPRVLLKAAIRVSSWPISRVTLPNPAAAIRIKQP